MAFSIIIYLLCLIAVFAFNVVNTSYVPYVLDTVFIVFSLFSLAMVIFLRMGIDVEFAEHDGSADRTLNNRIPIRIINKTFLPLTLGNIRIKVKYTGAGKNDKVRLRFMCPAKSESEYELMLKCPHCELVKITMKNVYVFDYLCIFRLSRKLRISTELVVLPKLPDVEFLNMMSAEIGNDEENLYSTVKAGDDPTEIFAIREYEGGDRIRNIHWKLSAKMDGLMVKEYGLQLHEQDTVVFDTYRLGKKNKIIRDEMFDLLYGLTYAMTGRGFGFNLCYFNGEFVNKRIETQNDINSIFADLYSIEPYGTETTCAEMYCTLDNKIKHRAFYVTEQLNETTRKNMRMLQSSGPVYYLIPGEMNGERTPVKFTEYERA